MRRIFVGIVALLVIGCGSDDQEQSSCEAAEAKLQECFDVSEPADNCDEAEAERIASMSCAELEGDAADSKADGGCPAWVEFIPILNWVCDDDDEREPYVCDPDAYETCEDQFANTEETRILEGTIQCDDGTLANQERIFVRLDGYISCSTRTDEMGRYSVAIPVGPRAGNIERCPNTGWPFRGEFLLPSGDETAVYNPYKVSCPIGPPTTD